VELAEEILRRLREEFKTSAKLLISKIMGKYREPFHLLIGTILSQNTNDKNSIRAFTNLASKFELRPEVLASANISEIEEAIKIGGLYRNKARKIVDLSKIIVNEYNGRFEELLKGDLNEVRERLLKLPGIGPKTADIVLLFYLKKPVIPIDTHIKRVSKRLKLTSKSGYEDIRRALQSIFRESDYLDVHFLLILLGREYCKARNPLCDKCPLSDLCPSSNR